MQDGDSGVRLIETLVDRIEALVGHVEALAGFISEGDQQCFESIHALRVRTVAPTLVAMPSVLRHDSCARTVPLGFNVADDDSIVANEASPI